jgi:hypothetical protein
MTTKKKSKTDCCCLADLFNGKKAKWLPLYHRLLARLSNVSGIEFFLFKNVIAIGQKNDKKPSVGEVKITASGLEVSLALSSGVTKSKSKNELPALKASKRLHSSKSRSSRGITHRVLIAKASEIDEEFMSWLKAARHQARIAKPRST